MLRYFTFCCLLLLSSCQNDAGEEKPVIELPVEIQEGFGPFEGSYSVMFAEHTPDNPDGAPWVPTYRPLKGVPEQWRNVVKSMIWLDGYQLVYQNFYEGKISEEMYQSLQESWEWTPDEMALSKKPIKCFVYTIRGVDKRGNAVVMIDTNNNLDFSDEAAFYPEKLFGKGKTMNRDSMRVSKKVWRVAFERIEDGEVVRDTLPMLVKHAVDHDEKLSFWYAFPRYGKAKLSRGGREYEILVKNDFDRATFVESALFVNADEESGKRLVARDGVSQGELLQVGSWLNKTKYRFAGINCRTGAIRLHTEDGEEDPYSTQRGYRFKPFAARDFLTGNTIDLEKLKGKYVFIDFWGTWCGPCVEQLPRLREVYKQVDHNQVVFVGIVGEDSGARLGKFLKKNPLEWPQLLSDSINKLVETYNIKAYPTTILIGPDGRVVDKNIHSEALLARFKAISNEKTL